MHLLPYSSSNFFGSFDITTLTFVQSVSVPAGSYATRDGFHMSVDGTKVYLTATFQAAGSFSAQQFSLSTPFDISTLSFDFEKVYNPTNPINASQQGCFIKDDGTIFYVVMDTRFSSGPPPSVIYAIPLSTAFDFTTLSNTLIPISIAGLAISTIQGSFFKPDGTEYYFGDRNGIVYQTTLSIPWDLTSNSNLKTATTLSEGGAANNGNAPIFNLLGSKMYISSGNSNTIFEYSVTTPWDITTISYLGKSSAVPQVSNPQIIHISEDGKNFYILSRTSNSIQQYTIA